jgi:hypothetical protein
MRRMRAVVLRRAQGLWRATLRFRVVLPLVCAVAAMPHYAAATSDPGRVDVQACLEWTSEASVGCATEGAIKAAVENVLGHPAFLGDRCDLWVSGSTRRSPQGSTVSEVAFRAHDGSSLGVRHLEGPNPSCSAYTGPISLVIALMIESVELSTTITGSPVSAFGASPPSQPTPSAPAPSDARKRERPARLSPLAVVGEMRAAWGLLPGSSLGVAGGIEVNPIGLPPLRIEATVWAPTSNSKSGPGGRFWAWHAGMGVCPGAYAGAIRAQLFIGLQVGFLYGSGNGLDSNQKARQPYGEAEIRAMNAIPLVGPLELVALAGLAIPWIRPGFVYLDPSGSSIHVHRPEAIIIEAGFGLMWQMGSTGKEEDSSR